MAAVKHDRPFPLLCLLLASTSIHSYAQDGGGAFKVAIWGDLPYRGKSDDVFDPADPDLINGVSVGLVYARLRDSINESNAAFSLHAGDVKKAARPCYNSKYYDRFEDLANSLHMPVFLTPGDNDWSDCHNDLKDLRVTTQAQALQNVKDRFYSNTADGSPILGSNTEAWSTEVTTAESDNYPELQRFIYNDIMFVVVHVVGSNNNRYSTCSNRFDTVFNCPHSLALTDFCCNNARAEHEARNFKVNEFLQVSFRVATEAGAKGVVVFAHAAMFDLDGKTRFTDGFYDFYDTLRAETLLFEKPVVYVHGDGHRYKDYIPDIDGVPPNLQALMVPGDEKVGWVEAIIDGDASPVFSFTLIDLTAGDV